jgi:hypothetical protein
VTALSPRRVAELVASGQDPAPTPVPNSGHGAAPANAETRVPAGNPAAGAKPRKLRREEARLAKPRLSGLGSQSERGAARATPPGIAHAQAPGAGP